MEFRDLKIQYQVLKEEMQQEINCVLEKSNYISGIQVKELEKELAEYVGSKYCITCANGTDALQLALMAWNVREGDAVFLPDFTFFSTGEVVASVGATPIFVNVDKDTYNISICHLQEKIEEVIKVGELRPAVVISVDLFGLPADYDKLVPMVEKYGMYLLEDGAQGFGGSIRGKKACSFGDISTTSFFPAKPLGCYGDGGAIFTDNDEWAQIISSLCVHGKGENKYDNVRIGMNSRLDTIQAAILKVKLRQFKKYELEKINEIASWYNERLQRVVKIPHIPEGYVSSYAQYTILFTSNEERNLIQQECLKAGIPTMIYYGKPMHKQIAFSDYKDEELYTKEICERVLSLPMHPYMTIEDVDKVCNIVKRSCKKYSLYM